MTGADQLLGSEFAVKEIESRKLLHGTCNIFRGGVPIRGSRSGGFVERVPDSLQIVDPKDGVSIDEKHLLLGFQDEVGPPFVEEIRDSGPDGGDVKAHLPHDLFAPHKIQFDLGARGKGVGWIGFQGHGNPADPGGVDEHCRTLGLFHGKETIFQLVQVTDKLLLFIEPWPCGGQKDAPPQNGPIVHADLHGVEIFVKGDLVAVPGQAQGRCFLERFVCWDWFHGIFQGIIQIRHTMGVPLGSVGKRGVASY